MAAEDPYVVLGVPPDATEHELRAARRRRALDLHPDLSGGTAHATAAMQALNEAFDAALARLGTPEDASGAPPRAGAAPPSSPMPPADVRAPGSRSGGRLAHDVASFTIEALPVEAFEALLVVATWIGEPIDDDQPYRLEVVLGDPFGCWCRLDLVPDAGASTVALTLGSIDGRPVPDLDAVRDAWVAALNSLGRAEP